MSSTERSIRAGTAGRAHGLDGNLYVADPLERLRPGDAVRVGTFATVVERVAGTSLRPIVHLRGVDTRDDADALRGAAIYLSRELVPGEYLAAELVGCRVDGVGDVKRVVSGPSCDVLEVGEDGVLIPFVRDAVRRVDTAAGLIEVDLDFLGLR